MMMIKVICNARNVVHKLESVMIACLWGGCQLRCI